MGNTVVRGRFRRRLSPATRATVAATRRMPPNTPDNAPYHSNRARQVVSSKCKWRPSRSGGLFDHLGNPDPLGLRLDLALHAAHAFRIGGVEFTDHPSTVAGKQAALPGDPIDPEAVALTVCDGGQSASDCGVAKLFSTTMRIMVCRIVIASHWKCLKGGGDPDTLERSFRFALHVPHALGIWGFVFADHPLPVLRQQAAAVSDLVNFRQFCWRAANAARSPSEIGAANLRSTIMLVIAVAPAGGESVCLAGHRVNQRWKSFADCGFR